MACWRGDMNNSEFNPAHSFRTSVALVLEQVKHVKELHRSAYSKRLSFALDVCLVVHGVRTGYLVDAVCSPCPTETFRTLLTTLREKSTAFNAVVFWHHVPTTQSFLVHVPLLKDRITALLGGFGEEVFVKLDKCPSALGVLPHPLQEALYGMKFTMAQSPDAPVLLLSELFAKEVVIPLAAVLIDYPVAYFPASSAQTSFLEGEPLDIYTVSFKWTRKNSDFTLHLSGEHVLLKFSCPQVLASNYAELSPSTMISKLHVKFAAILQRIGASILVTHRTETLDRVAL